MAVSCQADSNRVNHWDSFCALPQNANSLRIIARNDFLLIAGAIAVVAGFLFPLSAHILDVLLIFSLSLTAAVLIITFSARRSLEVSGFPLLIVLTTMLRITLSVTSAKLILSQNEPGAIISFLGGLIVRNNCVIAILVFEVLAVVIFGIISKAVKSICRMTSDFTVNIVPVKQTNIDCDINAGVINPSQAAGLREKIVRETGFFVAMTGAARFILCEAVIEFAIIIVNIVSSMAIGVAESTSTGTSVKTYATLAVGAGTVTLVSALLAAAASRYLVRKSFASGNMSEQLEEQEPIKRIEVVANDITTLNTIEPQDGDDISYAEPAEYSDGELTEMGNSAANANIKIEKNIIAEEVEWFDESECLENEYEKNDLSLWNCREIKENNSYEAIADLIRSKQADAKTILMAAENVEELAVTVPVNIAMRLAHSRKKCLLIDLDFERGAISKVFEIDSGGGDEKPAATCINNIWVWQAGKLIKENPINLRDVIIGLERSYDYLIIYAPKIKELSGWDKLAEAVKSTMLFGKRVDESNNLAINDLRKVLVECGCEIIEREEVFASAG